VELKMPDSIIWTRTSDGISLAFGATPESPYQLLQHDGFAVGEFDHVTTRPIVGHGDYWTDLRFRERVVTLDVLLRASGLGGLQNLRSQLISALNPIRGGGTLALTQSNGLVRALDCVLAEPPPMATAQHIGGRALRTTLRLRSTGDPFFYDPAGSLAIATVPIGVVSNFIFPWSFPWTLGASGIGAGLELTNAGDVPTPLEIWVTGQAVTPKIRNTTTGEAIEFNRPAAPLTVANGSVLYVNTDPRRPVVQIDGVDAWIYLSRAELWQVQPGVNDVAVEVSGATTANSAAALQFQNRYLGV
jgi:hypothetical protein